MGHAQERQEYVARNCIECSMQTHTPLICISLTISCSRRHLKAVIYYGVLFAAAIFLLVCCIIVIIVASTVKF